MYSRILIVAVVCFLASPSCSFKLNGYEKFYLNSCANHNCEVNLDRAVASGCLGKQMCMNTLTEERDGCRQCGDDIFDVSAFEIINGFPYLVCNSAVPLHVSVCKFYCHANWNPNGGKCVRLANGAPVCQCN